MAAEYVCCLMTSQKIYSNDSQSKKMGLLQQPIKKDRLLRQPIMCYKITKRTYNFVMTYVGNHMINMTLVMLFLVVIISICDIRGKSYDK